MCTCEPQQPHKARAQTVLYMYVGQNVDAQMNQCISALCPSSQPLNDLSGLAALRTKASQQEAEDMSLDWKLEQQHHILICSP